MNESLAALVRLLAEVVVEEYLAESEEEHASDSELNQEGDDYV